MGQYYDYELNPWANQKTLANTPVSQLRDHHIKYSFMMVNRKLNSKSYEKKFQHTYTITCRLGCCSKCESIKLSRFWYIKKQKELFAEMAVRKLLDVSHIVDLSVLVDWIDS